MQGVNGGLVKYLLLLLCLPAQMAHAEPARFFYSELPPYEQTAADGRAEGFGIRIITQILKDADFTPVFELYSIQRGVAALKSDIDFTTIVSPTLEQQAEFTLSKLPVYVIEVGVVRLRNTPALTQLAALQQHHYVSLTATRFFYLHDAFTASPAFLANRYIVSTLDDALRLVMRGRYDYFLSYFLSKQELKNPFLVFDPMMKLPVYLAMANAHPQAEQMMHRIDAVMAH